MSISQRLVPTIFLTVAVLLCSCNTSGGLGDNCLVDDYCEDGRYRCPEDDRTTPISVSTTGVVQLAVGRYMACVVKSDGELRCWGGADFSAEVPAELGPVVDVNVNFSRACAVTSEAAVRCWNDDGFTSDVPADLEPASRVSTGLRTTCALLRSGAVRCWGEGAEVVNAQLASVTDAVDIGMGFDHGCVLRENGGVVCWASSMAGERDAMVPDDLPPARGLTVGWHHACVILRDTGRPQCWGSTFSPPTTNLDDLALLETGARTNCAVNGQGNFECWDDIDCGLVLSPTTLGDVVMAGVGRHYACALQSDETLTCWGDFPLEFVFPSDLN